MPPSELRGCVAAAANRGTVTTIVKVVFGSNIEWVDVTQMSQ